MADWETRDSGPPRGDELAAGRDFAGHRILVELGRGGMGVVYRAHDPALDRDRAIKVIAPALSADPKFRDRFRRESRLAAQIEHPNVIPIYRAGEESGRLFLVMRLVDGADLRRLVAEQGALEPARAARIVAQIAGALDAASAGGLVHRDVKPANVLVEGPGDRERVFLTDFGISRSESGGTITDSGEVMGSVDYAAPEQLEGGAVDSRADVYALACVAFYALTGQPPFPDGSDIAKLYAHVHAPRPRASAISPHLPAGVDDALVDALAVDPAERTQSAGEFAAALEASLLGIHDAETSPIRHRPPRAPSAGRGGESTGRSWVWVTAAVGILAAVVATVLIVATSGGGGSPGQPRVVATIAVGQGAGGVAVSSNDAWVALHSGAVAMIDRRTNRRVGAPIDVGGSPSSIAIAFGSVWVTDSSGGTLVRIQHRRVVQRIPVGRHPSDVIAANGFVWVAAEGDDAVKRVDPYASPPAVTATVPIPGAPHALAIGDGGVWVASFAGGTISKIDPGTAKAEGPPVRVGPQPTDLATVPDAVWVVDNTDDTLTAVDPRTDRVRRTVRVGPRPRGLHQGLGYLWVANGGNSTVWRVDTSTGRRVGQPIRVGRDPADITVGEGSVWTADYVGGTVTRIRP